MAAVTPRAGTRGKQPRSAAGVAHAGSVRAEIAEIAASLQELLGQKLTAVIAGVTDARAVGD